MEKIAVCSTLLQVCCDDVNYVLILSWPCDELFYVFIEFASCQLRKFGQMSLMVEKKLRSVQMNILALYKYWD